VELNSTVAKNEEAAIEKITYLEKKLLETEKNNIEKINQINEVFNEQIMEFNSVVENNNILLTEEIEKHKRKHRMVRNLKILLFFLLISVIYYLPKSS
jgi:molecular chaperone GrpE (heat shock protein)